MEDGDLNAANPKRFLLSANSIVERMQQKKDVTRQRWQRAGAGWDELAPGRCAHGKARKSVMVEGHSCQCAAIHGPIWRHPSRPTAKLHAERIPFCWRASREGSALHAIHLLALPRTW